MSFALDIIREAAFLIDDHARFQYVNEESSRMLGYTRDELLSLGVPDIDPDFPPGRWRSHWTELESRRSVTFEGRHRAKDGRLIPVEINANSFVFEGQRFILALVRDITERKGAEDLLRKREAELNESQRLAHIGSWDWDAVRDRIWWSDEYFRIYGLDPQKPTPSYAEHLKVYTPESAERLDALVKRAMETGEPYEVDLELAAPTESAGCILARGEAKRDEHGRIWGLRGTAQNITSRKCAEQALQRLNRELRAISDCNQTLMRTEDEQTLLDDICRIICEEAGYRMAWVGYAEEDETRTLRPVAWAGVEDGYLAQAHLTWADTERGRGPAGTAIRTAAVACIQDFAKDPQGSPWRDPALQRGYRSCVSLPLAGENAAPFGVLTIYSAAVNAFTADEVRLLEELAGNLAFGLVALRTRAERKWMEESLAKREREFRALAENSPDVIVRYDRECRRIYVNPTFERVNRLSSQEVLGKRPLELSTELAPMADPFTQRLKEVLSTGIATQIDLQWTRDGKENCWFVRAIPELDTNGEVASVLTIWTDITERKRLENALRESEQKFRSLAENSPEDIFRYDPHCRVIYANHQAQTTRPGGGESILGRTPLEGSPHGHYEGSGAEMASYQATLQRVIATGEMADVEIHVPDPSGVLRTHSVRFTAERDQDGRIVGALAFGRDITEKSRLEEQLMQAQKMEAVGQLAGGVAHDFNNILTAIIGFGTLAKMKMKPGDPQALLIDQILVSSDRAAHLTQGLLAFSRKQVLIPKPVDLNTIVQSVEKLLRRLIGEDVDLTVTLTGQNLIVMADAGQIEQVLMNLATNARDAMPDGGSLTIETDALDLGEGFVAAHGYGAPGRYARITVTDTGRGMDLPTRKRIFEPFFTTKERGKGTGLGLSMVYGIVKQHDGVIDVYSEPGEGSTFRIYLPLIALAVEEAQAEMEAPPPGGSETLLLAEDEPAVRAMMGSTLREFGYRVIEAVDGREALERFMAHAEEIDLLVLDVIMPKMNGKDVYEAVKAADPHAKALFISGYTADLIHRKGLVEGGIQFISKPMNPFELLRKIRSVLDDNG